MLTVEEIRADRPREVVRARLLSIIAVVLWTSVVGYLYPLDIGPYSAGYSSGAASLPLLLMFFCVWGAFGVAKGRQAARIMETIALGLLYPFVLPACWIGFSDPRAGGSTYALIDILSIVISSHALVLMYRPISNRYFHLITVARAAESKAR